MKLDRLRPREVLTLLALMVSVSVTVGVASAAEHPNILVILTDDMGYSDTSPYGGEIYTPSIAQLANQGLMLTNFHVAAYCAPTRGMLMTGADNHVIGLGNMIELRADNQVGRPGYEGYLNGRAPTLATMLRDAGYHTYLAGKWHLGKTPDSIPAAQGFEDSVGVLEGGADNWGAKSYSPGYKAVHFFDGRQPLELPAGFYSSSFYADRMIHAIDSHAGDGRPFFGYLAFQAVHQPHQAPAEFTARYISTYEAGWSAISLFRYQRMVDRGLMPPGLVMNRPSIVPDWSTLPVDERRMNAKRMAVYAGMLEYMDLSIGHVLDHLKAKGMLDNTIVLFASDNGGEATTLQSMFPEYYARNFDLSYERLGERGSYSEYGPGWASTSMTPFSNFKGSAAEGGVRAPFIIRYPAAIPQGNRSDAFAYVLDVVPTLLDLAGVRSTEGSTAPLSGQSMVPLLSGRTDRVHAADAAIGYEAAGGSAVYRGDYKLVRSVPPYGDGRWRLYNLRQDPTEARDLSAADPERMTSMMADFRSYVEKNGVVEVPADYNVIGQAQKNAAAQK
jgi:arylsulfatase A-like enzyme